MSDHDFEKRVKQKMDELRFRPSDAVWSGVERELRRSRPSRRGWVYLPVLVLLLGFTGYFVYDRYHTTPANTATLATKSSTGTDNPDLKKSSSANESNSTLTHSTPARTATAEPSADETTNADAANDKLAADKTTGTDRPANDKKSGKLANGTGTADDYASTRAADKKLPSGKNGVSRKNANTVAEAAETLADKDVDAALVAGKKTTGKKTNGKKPANKNSTDSGLAATGNRPAADTRYHADLADNSAKKINKSTTAKENINDGLKTHATVAGNEQATSKEDQTANGTGAQDNLLTDSADAANETAAAKIAGDSAKTVNNNIVKGKGKPGAKSKYKWQYGVNASVGVANLGDGNLNEALKTTANADVAQSAPTNNNYMFAPVTAGIPRPTPSEVKAGLQFSVGGFVRKQFSKRLSVSAGLQYSQFNNTIHIGYRVDSARLVNSGSQIMNVSRYYRADQYTKYSNKYHFIELPVSLHTQLNKSEKIPLFWNIGFTVSQLFASDALVFDSGTGVYYKDESFYRPTQVAVGTGFSIGVFSKSRTPLWIGPSVKYQATQLFNNDVSGEKHLMSASLDLRLFLNKK